MKLAEKIYYCRKKAGLSQEELAARIGVSRQSVSKWETGEAAPEISKLPLLAQAFHVSTDWLLSEKGPEPGPGTADASAERVPTGKEGSARMDAIPGVIGKLIRRYGWLYGVYTAIAGTMFLLMGA